MGGEGKGAYGGILGRGHVAAEALGRDLAHSQIIVQCRPGGCLHQSLTVGVVPSSAGSGSGAKLASISGMSSTTAS